MTRDDDYHRVASAISWLAARTDRQPGLEDLGRHLGLGPHHVQRLFKRWAGVSPKRFLQSATSELAKHRLARGDSVLAASLGAGLSGPGRLHDLLVSLEAMTPGELAQGGRGLEIRYGVHATPFGPCLVAETSRGVCRMAFRDEGAASPEDDLRARYPGARLSESPGSTKRIADAAFDGGGRVTLHVPGTNFQIQVWRALLAIPSGVCVTYGDVARALGQPRAARAVGSAVARNEVAGLIPCHRVIRASGGVGEYRWGPERKRTMLVREFLGV